MQKKEKLYEIEMYNGVMGGKIKLQNIDNRVMAKIGDIILDALNYYKWNNAVKFLDKYSETKAKRSVNGKETPLPPKFILEILENAFIEEDEEIQELWANLLINLQYAKKRSDIKMMFIEILRNLSKNEIQILSLINSDIIGDKIRWNKDTFIKGKCIRGHLNLSEEEYELAMLNLFRLYCCEGFHRDIPEMLIDEIPVHENGGIEKFRVTSLGYKLLDMIFES